MASQKQKYIVTRTCKTFIQMSTTRNTPKTMQSHHIQTYLIKPAKHTNPGLSHPDLTSPARTPIRTVLFHPKRDRYQSQVCSDGSGSDRIRHQLSPSYRQIPTKIYDTYYAKAKKSSLQLGILVSGGVARSDDGLYLEPVVFCGRRSDEYGLPRHASTRITIKVAT